MVLFLPFWEGNNKSFFSLEGSPMILLCPACDKDLVVTATEKPPVEIKCSHCSARAKISITIDLVEKSQDSSSVVFPAPNSKLILVAVEGEVTNEIISEILSEGGFEVISTISGDETLRQMCERRPVVSIIDVGIPKVFESVLPKTDTEAGLKDLGIILLSSIHNKTRYKREPETLYGADDHIERHHIEDRLLSKVISLVKGLQGDYVVMPEKSGPTAAPLPEQAPVEPVGLPPASVEPALVEAPSIEVPPVDPAVVETPAEPSPLSPVSEESPSEAVPVSPEPSVKKETPRGDLSSHDNAKRLARLIVSDIALYNQKRIEEGIKNGTVRELLKDELEEGQKLYTSRVPGDVNDGTNYYEEAISDFIQKQKDKIKG